MIWARRTAASRPSVGLSAGPFRRAARLAVAPALLAGAAAPAFGQLVPDGPAANGARQPASGGGFFGLVADGPPPAPPATATPPGYRPQTAAPRQAMTPQQAAFLRQQQAYRQRAAAAQYAARSQNTAPRAAQARGPARVSVVGAVQRPRTYEFSETGPELSALLDRAGGLTGRSNRKVRVIRGGQPSQTFDFTPGTNLPLVSGDVIVCDAIPGSGTSERATSYVALAGMADRPVVLNVPLAEANLPALLQSLGLPPATRNYVRVLAATGPAAGPLPDGAVVFFPPGVVPARDWGGYGFADLVKEEPRADSLADGAVRPTADGFAPVPPANGVTITPRSAAADRAAAPSAGPTFTPTPAVPKRTEGAATTGPVFPALSAPGLPVPAATGTSEPADGFDALAAPPAADPAPMTGPAVTLSAPEPSLAPPAAETGALETDITALYGPSSDSVAVLPPPTESPFYGGESYGPNGYGNGALVADGGSHLVPLDDFGLEAPGLPTPPAAVPASPNASGWRVADLPRPGVVSDARPAAPRPIGVGPGAKPIPEPPAVPAPAETNAEVVAPAEAGFPWLTGGFVLGALLGGGLAARAAVRRRAATVAAPVAAKSAPPEPVVKAAAPPVVAAAKAPAPAPAPPKPTALDDLIADRVPMSEEAVRLPGSVALHGASAGMGKLRIEPGATSAGPHYAGAGRTAAGAARTGRAEAVAA